MAMRWYIVHAYSNFERKVAESIKERAAAAGLSDLRGLGVRVPPLLPPED